MGNPRHCGAMPRVDSKDINHRRGRAVRSISRTWVGDCFRTLDALFVASIPARGLKAMSCGSLIRQRAEATRTAPRPRSTSTRAHGTHGRAAPEAGTLSASSPISLPRRTKPMPRAPRPTSQASKVISRQTQTWRSSSRENSDGDPHIPLHCPELRRGPRRGARTLSRRRSEGRARRKQVSGGF